ncbi:MAG: hypothetical protein HeimC2_36650 [Candidatus Heimdallarchaeota archaeon LC_2]|nr:MAG: hypothetical protein HeimC2_36650 [Candidatus Heimdallarchaeota archaeon LC_2]
MKDRKDPFSILLALQENFHESFNSIAEFQPVNDLILLMQNNYEECIKVLTSISDLGRLIYYRYIDERGKDQDRIKNDDILNSEMNHKIANVLELELSLAILLKIYTEIYRHNTGSMNDKNTVYQMLNVENIFEFLNSLFFNNEDPKDFLSNLTPYLSEINKLNQKQRSVQILNLIKKQDDNISFANIELFDLEGQFFLETLKPYFSVLQKNWWASDLSTEYFLQALGIENLDLVVQSWNQNPTHELASRIEQIKSSQLTIGETIRDFLKYKLFLNLAISNAKSNNHQVALQYLEAALGIEKMLETIREHPNLYSREIRDQVEYYYQRIIMATQILRLQIKFANLLNSLKKNNDILSNSSLIAEIHQMIKDSTSIIEIPYISAIPNLYLSMMNSLEFMVTLNKPIEEINQRCDDILETFTSRIDVAISQISSSLTNLGQETDKDNLKENTDKFLTECETLHFAIALLPSTSSDKQRLVTTLDCLINLCLSIQNEIKALETEESNKLLELIYKTRAYYFANQSKTLSSELDTKAVPIDRILAHFSGSYISAHTIQMHIYQLTTQYLCLSHVLPTLFFTMTIDENVFSSNNEVLSNILDIFESLIPFIEMINQIKQDCSNLLDHKERIGSILEQVKWDQIIFRKTLISGILTFFESIKNIILGLWSSNLGLYDQAKLNLNEATSFAFKSADILQSEEDSRLSDFSEHIFSFAQLSQGLSQNIRKSNLTDLPNQSLFKLFRDMVFAI